MTPVSYDGETETDRLRRRGVIYDPRTDEDPNERQRIETRVQLVKSLVSPEDTMYNTLLQRAYSGLTTSYLDYLRRFTE